MALVCLSLVFIILHTSLHYKSTFVIFKIKWIHILRTIERWMNEMNVWIAGWMYTLMAWQHCISFVTITFYMFTHIQNCIQKIYIHDICMYEYMYVKCIFLYLLVVKLSNIRF